jgi:hypothetical protein
MSRVESIADFLALRRNTALLLVALLLGGTGERLWLGFAPKYLETLGATVLVIGASPELRARTYGAYYLIRDCIVTIGSLLGAWLWSLSPHANFIGAAVFGGVGTLWFWWFLSRRAPESLNKGFQS